MKLTPDDIDSGGPAVFDIDGAVVEVARWDSDMYAGKPLGPGRWYVVASNGISIGLVDCSDPQPRAILATADDEELSRVVPTLAQGVKALVDLKWPMGSH